MDFCNFSFRIRLSAYCHNADISKKPKVALSPWYSLPDLMDNAACLFSIQVMVHVKSTNMQHAAYSPG